jgi:hypothetical protein
MEFEEYLKIFFRLCILLMTAFTIFIVIWFIIKSNDDGSSLFNTKDYTITNIVNNTSKIDKSQKYM